MSDLHKWKRTRKFIFFIFPIKGASWTNNIVNNNIKADFTDQKKVETINNMKSMINGKGQVIEKAYSDLSANMTQLRSSADSKASAFLGAAAIAVSLLSISIGLFNGALLTYHGNYLEIDLVGMLAAIIFVSGTVSFVLAGISSLKAIALQKWNIPQYIDINKLLSDKAATDDKIKEAWIAENLSYIKINELIYITKTNWLFSAQQHFIYAIVYVAIGFGLLLIDQIGDVYIYLPLDFWFYPLHVFH